MQLLNEVLLLIGHYGVLHSSNQVGRGGAGDGGFRGRELEGCCASTYLSRPLVTPLINYPGALHTSYF